LGVLDGDDCLDATVTALGLTAIRSAISKALRRENDVASLTVIYALRRTVQVRLATHDALSKAHVYRIRDTRE
jgi:predicted naringenin-chalcone synthase